MRPAARVEGGEKNLLKKIETASIEVGMVWDACLMCVHSRGNQDMGVSAVHCGDAVAPFV